MAGCAGGVPYLVVTAYSEVSANTFYVNQITGAVTNTAPSGFNTGECPPAKDYEYQIMCDAGNSNLPYLQIVGFNNQTGAATITNTALDGVTSYTPVTPSRCSDRERYDVTGTTEYCDGGVSLYGTAIYDVTTVPPTLVTTIYRNAGGTVVTPSGAVQIGKCSTAASTYTARGVSIAAGTFAATLGPDGTTWVAPATLKSVTVGARRSNTTDARNTAANRVQINFANGSYIVLLTNEIRTWSVEDLNLLGGITNVQTVGNAAALVNYNL